MILNYKFHSLSNLKKNSQPLNHKNGDHKNKHFGGVNSMDERGEWLKDFLNELIMKNIGKNNHKIKFCKLYLFWIMKSYTIA